MRSTWRIETMDLPKLSRTVAYTTRWTVRKGYFLINLIHFESAPSRIVGWKKGEFRTYTWTWTDHAFLNDVSFCGCWTVCYWARAVCKEKARVLFLNIVLFWVCFLFVGECQSSFEWLIRSIENIFFDRRISYFDYVVDNVVSLTDFILSHVVMLSHVTFVTFSRWEMCCFVLSSSICFLTCSVDTY